MTEAILAVIAYIAFIAIVVGVLRRMNGEDTNAQQAADSVRAALNSDARLDEMQDYTTNHVRAGTAWGREL
jgi:hypothetical protein